MKYFLTKMAGLINASFYIIQQRIAQEKDVDISVWPFILLFCILAGIQLFMDILFYFVCYLTGVFVLKTIVILNTRYRYMSYKVFKDRYKTVPGYKTPMIIGAIVWFGLLFLIMLLD